MKNLILYLWMQERDQLQSLFPECLRLLEDYGIIIGDNVLFEREW